MTIGFAPLVVQIAQRELGPAKQAQPQARERCPSSPLNKVWW